ncbi:MAG: GNAT family N-acetyltransferase [Anaerolineae bacterium]|nr:GNAT family N-acetyltransferase [Anaerolineae bacterium]
MATSLQPDRTRLTPIQSDKPSYIIREAQPEDAAAIITYFRHIFAEPGINLITEVDEFSPTVESESRIIRDMGRAENSLFLVAESDGRIIGQLTLEGGRRRNVRHMATLGITVAEDWRDQGIGRQLMERAIHWARDGGIIRRIELHVFARNERAIHLYEKCGFVTEGRRRRAVIRDGEYLDDLVMGLLL